MKRTILSGRKKTNDLTSTNPKTKPTSLFDHTTKLVRILLTKQQKLLKLKQQLHQKKKSLPPTLTSLPTSHPKPQSQFLLTNPNLCIPTSTTSKFKFKPSSNQLNKGGVEMEMEKQLSQFLRTIGMEAYEGIFLENGIDCFQVLREVKQKEIQEIGVAKGHALKIIVSMRKLLQTRQKTTRKQLSSAQTAQNTAKITSKSHKNPRQQAPNHKNNHKLQSHPEPLEIVIQTEQGFSPEEELPKHRYFCLYCYQVAAMQFCGEDCQQLYNRMFKKYQRNLQKAQELYSGPLQKTPIPDPQPDQSQFLTDLQFLDLNQPTSFNLNPNLNLDQQCYNEALDLIRLTLTETKQEQAWQTYQENQRIQKQLQEKEEEEEEEEEEEGHGEEGDGKYMMRRQQ